MRRSGPRRLDGSTRRMSHRPVRPAPGRFSSPMPKGQPDIRRGGSMPNAEKTAAVAEISEQFTNSAAAVITEYRGLSVKQLTDLRRALGRDTTYAVVKNTLTKRAVAEAGVPIDDQLLV